MCIYRFTETEADDLKKSSRRRKQTEGQQRYQARQREERRAKKLEKEADEKKKRNTRVSSRGLHQEDSPTAIALQYETSGSTRSSATPVRPKAPANPSSDKYTNP